jgi:hypothetical protein
VIRKPPILTTSREILMQVFCSVATQTPNHATRFKSLSYP